MIKQAKWKVIVNCWFVLAVAASKPLWAGNGEEGAKKVTTDFVAAAKIAVPAVVSIRTKAPEDNRFNRAFEYDFFEQFFGNRFKGQSLPEQESPWIGQASGFLISPDGYILTNNHVINKAGQIKVSLNDGKEFDAKIIGQDPNTDIAVIKIEGENLPFLKIGNSDDLEVGQWVIAVGTPLGLQASLSVGVVSAKGRNNLDLATIEDFIQTDAPINRGNSGGPLLDLDGKVIGINTAIASNMGGYMGIGFAIPSAIVEPVMRQIIDQGIVKRGFLGVALQNVDPDLAKAFGLSKVEGALVAEVSRGSPASKAGLRQGDVIMKYQATEVKNITSLRNAIALMSPGTEMKLTVLRDGRSLVIPVEVGIFPGSGTEKKIEAALHAPVENRLGFEVEKISSEMAQRLGVEEGKGVMISHVKPGSPAAWSGMKKGALILEVNKQAVSSPQQFNQIIDNTPQDRPLLFLIRQEGQMRFLSLKIG